MNIISAIAKNGGMLFQNKRLSRDEKVCEKILSLSENSRLFMTPSSAALFSPSPQIQISETPLLSAEKEDFCFMETSDFNEEQTDTIYLFCWNRDYPADTFFPFDLEEKGFRCIKKEDFQGSSHKKITLKVFRRNEK